MQVHYNCISLILGSFSMLILLGLLRLLESYWLLRINYTQIILTMPYTQSSILIFLLNPRYAPLDEFTYQVSL